VLGILARAVAGLLAYELALASATSTAARHAALIDRSGRLRPVCDADLLLGDGDPLTGITPLARVNAVMTGEGWAEATGPAVTRTEPAGRGLRCRRGDSPVGRRSP
jgi:cytosine/adenosine deaminase-related metal-dependent hydrolase